MPSTTTAATSRTTPAASRPRSRTRRFTVLPPVFSTCPGQGPGCYERDQRAAQGEKETLEVAGFVAAHGIGRGQRRSKRGPPGRGRGGRDEPRGWRRRARLWRDGNRRGDGLTDGGHQIGRRSGQ